MEEYENLAEQINNTIANAFEDVLDDDIDVFEDCETATEARETIEDLESARAELLTIKRYVNSLIETANRSIAQGWEFVNRDDDEDEPETGAVIIDGTTILTATHTDIS